MIPADILLVIALVAIGGPVAWLAARWLIVGAAKARERLMAANTGSCRLARELKL